jgi:hypothetical protein
MKNTIIILALLFFSTAVFAQKGKEKQKEKDNTSQVDVKVKVEDNKQKEKGNSKMDDHDRRIWGGIGDQDCTKPSKNQPAKVTASFNKNYPNVVNVRWTKCRGDWTATFNNGIFRSTAVYHANGDRKDTRTPIKVEEAPKSIFDKILKQDPDTKIEEVVKIEQPKTNTPGDNSFFRILRSKMGTTTKQYVVVNSSGDEVKYDY